MRHIENSGIAKQFIQVFSGIFRNIQPCSGNWGMFSHIQTYSELCVTLAFATVLEPATSSKACQRCKMIRHNKSLIVNSFILGLFWYVDAYSATLTGAQLGGSPLLPLFENRKKCPYFGNKGPDSAHLWVKFTIQNVPFRIARRKIYKMLPYRAFLSWKDVYWSVLVQPNLSCPENVLIAFLHSDIILFCKTLHLKCLTVVSIRLCLDNCSVICTVTLCFVLHQTNLKF